MASWRGKAREPVELAPEEAYDLWAPTYSPHAHNRLMALEEGAVRELLPDANRRRVLDLGCGSGRYLSLLLAKGASAVTGCDLSTEMLARARAVSPRLVRADLAALPFAHAAFDIVVCGLAVGHVSDLRGALREMARVLSAGGAVVYSDVHPVGALAGWKRTFSTSTGENYAVRHQIHLYADHQEACQAAGLVIDGVLEPRIDFEDEWNGYPAALVIRARKSGA